MVYEEHKKYDFKYHARIVPPKSVQYLILNIEPFIAVKKIIENVVKKDTLSELEAINLKSSLLYAIQQH